MPQQIVAEHVLPFLTAVYPFSHFLMVASNKMTRNHVSHWLLEHDTELTVDKWPPHPPRLSRTAHIWNAVEREIHIVLVQLTDLQLLWPPCYIQWASLCRVQMESRP